MQYSSDDSLLSLAEQRRSVRQYTNDPIDRETIDKILTVAALIPSSYGQNPVGFGSHFTKAFSKAFLLKSIALGRQQMGQPDLPLHASVTVWHFLSMVDL